MSYRDYEFDRSDVPEHRTLREKYVVARKDHVCFYCKKTIAKGEKHHVIVALEDGQFYQTRSHDGRAHCIEGERYA